MKTLPQSSAAIANSVREFIASARSISVEKITLDQSLFHDLGIDGDDAFDLLPGFAAEFNVSLAGFDFEKYFGAEAASGPIAFFVELVTQKKSQKLQRLEISDLIWAVSNGSFSDLQP